MLCGKVREDAMSSPGPGNNTCGPLGFSSRGSRQFFKRSCKECVSDREGVGWPQAVRVTAQTWFGAHLGDSVNTWLAVVWLASLPGLCVELAMAVCKLPLSELISQTPSMSPALAWLLEHLARSQGGFSAALGVGVSEQTCPGFLLLL